MAKDAAKEGKQALERQHVKGYFFLLCHDTVTVQGPCSSCGVQGLSNEGCPSLYPMPVLMNGLSTGQVL